MSTASPEAGTGDTDPVERHIAALDAALEGPARVKARLLAEARDDLAEAVAERTRAGSTQRSVGRRPRGLRLAGAATVVVSVAMANGLLLRSRRHLGQGG